MRKIVINSLLIIGILLVLYPFIGRVISKFNQTIVISNYKKEVSLMSNKEKEEAKSEYKKCNNGKSSLNLLDTGECLGYIDIPKINVYLPIYEGTSDDVLLQGIGHLKSTSLPIGGKNSNSVLVGHTGITANTFFDNLIDLELEDVFYIYILDDVLKYEVTDIKVVLPDDTENIKTIEEKDLVTLVTCTPKYVNSHRLLVISERIECEKNNIENSNKENIVTIINEYKWFIVIVIIIFMIFVAVNSFIKL